MIMLVRNAYTRYVHHEKDSTTKTVSFCQLNNKLFQLERKYREPYFFSIIVLVHNTIDAVVNNENDDDNNNVLIYS